MNLFFIIVLSTYLVAVNGYGILLLFFQRNELVYDTKEEKTIPDTKLLLVGVLGGALGILSFMFILKYRLKNLPLMLLLPVFVAINVFISFVCFKYGTRIFIR